MTTLSSPNKTVVPVYPTWMNTIHNNARNYGHILDFSQAAGILGYAFVLWNDEVYACTELDEHGDWMAVAAGWDTEDVNYFTVHHPQLNKFIDPSGESW